jgi:hypothetical protein
VLVGHALDRLHQSLVRVAHAGDVSLGDEHYPKLASPGGVPPSRRYRTRWSLTSFVDMGHGTRFQRWGSSDLRLASRRARQFSPRDVEGTLWACNGIDPDSHTVLVGLPGSQFVAGDWKPRSEEP